MRHLKSLPQDTQFFTTYARLASAIRKSGWAAQLVSGLTEVGGIYAAAYVALQPIIPEFAIYIAAVIAIIGTLVIELGLRVLAPHTVDAILYRRFKGLYLAMTIPIWIMTVLLVTTSGFLSFHNSHSIVEQIAPSAQKETTTNLDSLREDHLSKQRASWVADSLQIVTQVATQLDAEKEAYDNKIKAVKRSISNIYNKEKRTGQSYATTKDKLRQSIADLKAEQAVVLAQLKARQSKEFAEAKQLLRQNSSTIHERHTMAVDSILALNQSLSKERTATVSAYGGGLAWFTIIALFVFIASVILDRIHCKGSGIEEAVDLSQYDISPSAIAEALIAVHNRLQFIIRNQIRAFTEKTPPAPLPSTPTELYDPTQLTNVIVNLQILEEETADSNIIYIEPKRRKIGFQHTSSSKAPHIENTGVSTNQDAEKTDTHTKKATPTHENSCAVKGTRMKTDKNMTDLLQRLKDYKKRLGKHEQKKLALERAGKAVPKRTLNAISNNTNWVEHYEQLIKQAKQVE